MDLILKQNHAFCLWETMLMLMVFAVLLTSGIPCLKRFKQCLELHYHTLSLVSYLKQLQSRSFWYKQMLYVKKMHNSNGNCLQVEFGSPKILSKVEYRYCFPDSMQIDICSLSAGAWHFFKSQYAYPGTITLQNKSGITHIKIANSGRIRYCSPNHAWLDIPQC